MQTRKSFFGIAAAFAFFTVLLVDLAFVLGGCKTDVDGGSSGVPTTGITLTIKDEEKYPVEYPTFEDGTTGTFITLSIAEGSTTKSVQLIATVEPEEANQTVIWDVYAPKGEITVDKNGLVTGIAETIYESEEYTGPTSYPVTAFTADKKYYATVYIQVTAKIVPISLTLSIEDEEKYPVSRYTYDDGSTSDPTISLSIAEGSTTNTVKLNAAVTPENVELIWESSDPSKVSVDENGLVTALEETKIEGGDWYSPVTISVHTPNYEFYKYCYIYVYGYIPVQNIYIKDSYATQTLYCGESSPLKTYQLEIDSIYPNYATNKTITWTSSDPSKVSVDENGLATAIAATEDDSPVTITASAEGGTVTATKTIAVKEYIPAQKIILSTDELTINKSSTNVKITVTVEPENATVKSIIWTSSDAESEKIKISGGNYWSTYSKSATLYIEAVEKTDSPVILTATIDDGVSENGPSATCAVTVAEGMIAVQRVSVKKPGDYNNYISTDKYALNHTGKYEYEVTPAGANIKSVTWKTSDESIATVDQNGLVTGVSAGNAKITVEVTDVLGNTVTDYENCYVQDTGYYAITYNLNGGTPSEKSKDYYASSGSSIYSPYGSYIYSPSKTGYTFAGWYLDSKFITELPTEYGLSRSYCTVKSGTTGNLTLFAKWTPDEYKITYDVGNVYNAHGKAPDENPSTYTIETETFTLLPGIPNKGYEFISWTDSKGNAVTQIEKGTTGNITLTANFDLKTYPITYVLNGGTNNSQNPESYTYATSGYVRAYAPGRRGYLFNGWYTDSDFTNDFPKSIGQDTWYFSPSDAEPKTFYAKWGLDTYYIYYSLNKSETNSPENPSTYTVESDTINLQDATRDYYTFINWTDSNGNVVTTIPKGSVGSITLKANFTPIEYHITYELNGGTNNENNVSTYTYSSSNSVKLNAPTWTGYTFGGWYTDSDFTESSKVTSLDTAKPSDVTLYAKWTPIEYSLIYTILNGSADMKSAFTSSAKYTVENTALSYPEAKENLTFKGWYADEDLTEAVSNLEGKTEDLTLYGKWVGTKYKVEYVGLEGATLYSGTPVTGFTTEDTSITLPEYIKPGYETCYFYTDSEHKKRIEELTITSAAEGSTLTLYAGWPAIIYKITYEMNGGKFNYKTEKYTGGYTIEGRSDFITPERAGYTFAGWYSDPDFSEGSLVTEIAQGSMGDITLYAKWTGNMQQYTVLHYLEKLDGTYTQAEFEYLTGPTGELTSAKAKSYEHFTAQDFEQEPIDYGSKGTEIKIYYTRDTVTFTLALASGTLGGETGTVTKTEKYETAVSIANPTRKGYTFAGWTTAGGTLPSKYENNATYTALWTALKGISVTVQNADITIAKTQSGNTLTFTAEDCTSYTWTLDGETVSQAKTCTVDTTALKKGTYSLSLEAQKDGKWYSYYAQIKVK